MLTILFELLIITWIFGSLVSLLSFVRDVHKWHEPEDKFEVKASADMEESEVNDNANNVGEHNSSAVSFTWGESGLHTNTEI